MSQHERMMIAKAREVHETLTLEQREEMKNIILETNPKPKSMRSIERYQRGVQDPAQSSFWRLRSPLKEEEDWGAVSPAVKWADKEAEAVHVPSLIKEQGKMYQAKNLAPFNRPPLAKGWPYYEAANCQVVLYTFAFSNGIMEHAKKLPDIGLKKEAEETKRKSRKRKLLAKRKILPTHLHSEDTETVLIEGERELAVPSSLGHLRVGLSSSLMCSDEAFLRQYYKSILSDMFFKHAPSQTNGSTCAAFFGDPACAVTLDTAPLRSSDPPPSN